MRIALVLLVACAPLIVYRDIKPENVTVTKPCAAWPPPSSPRDHGVCADMTAEECRALMNARWSDYGHEAARWFELEWPACQPL